MSDPNVIFKNRADVKWFDTFDSYMISSQVGTGAGAVAELTLGSSEIMSSSTNVVTTASSGTLITGVAEILGSTSSLTSSTTPTLELGIAEIYPMITKRTIVIEFHCRLMK